MDRDAGLMTAGHGTPYDGGAMNKYHVFLVSNKTGLVRAEPDATGGRTVNAISLAERPTCLAAVPSLPRRIYVGTENGVFRSDDGGLSWRPVGMSGCIVKALTVSPQRPTPLRVEGARRDRAIPSVRFVSSRK